ncbi:F-box protein At4g00755-like isoform X1 [Cucurbita pepo subsp. pepo]|uniref:F-box protein At4g00755-like isoform X1 n=1 Tax=Cucurbita pepo subsp. pepo TaxID=3664 RepID=UPI000C9D539D|nr:F-box protein At4g00755-like isoform X1 [Cucurbita pepo subsp. pepo]
MNTSSWDILKWLGVDLSLKIFTHLDDLSDLVRICLVSSSWRQLVIENSLSKQLFLRLFPDLSGAAHFIEVNGMIDTSTVESSNITKGEYLLRLHRIYLLLARSLNPVTRNDCIGVAIEASSTDNNPLESIENTLEPGDRLYNRASYWSSLGSRDPDVPETLTYGLVSNLCAISEIHIQPFLAYFQDGFPIYSAKAVRFKMGHQKLSVNSSTSVSNGLAVDYSSASDHFIWTYVSPEFPMAQENTLQIFKLPEPAFCVGGVLQVELLGRVQRQEMDGLYYLCVSHVEVVGRPLLPEYDVDIIDQSGKCILKYFPELPEPSSTNGEIGRGRSRASRLVQRGVHGWEHIVLNTLLGGRGMFDDDDDIDEETAEW